MEISKLLRIGPLVALLAGGLAPVATNAATEIGDPTPWPHCSYLPAAARTLNLQGTFWATDLDVVNTGSSPSRVSIALLSRGTDNTTAPVMIVDEPLAAGAGLLIEDVVAEVLGAIWRDWLGGIAVCAEHPGVEALGRAYRHDDDSGSVGQGIPGARAAEAIPPGSTGHLFGLREDASFRCNVGLLNPADTATRVTLRLVADDGHTALVIIHDLLPYSQVQYNRILARYPGIELSHARVEVSSTDGPVFAYASLVDNRTNDPVYISARVAEGGSRRSAVKLAE